MTELERMLHHSDWLRRLAARLVGDAAAADDLVQDAWLAALEGSPDPRRPVKPWLAGVARRLASLRARSGARRGEREERAARGEALPDAAAALERIETERRLAAAVLGLGEPARTVVVLRYYEELSTSEVARRLGVPEATVRSRLKRGLGRLRARLDAEGGGRSEWLGALAVLVERSGPGAAGSSAATLAAGGALVSTMKVAAAAVAIAAVGGLLWFAGPSVPKERAGVAVEERVARVEAPSSMAPAEGEPSAGRERRSAAASPETGASAVAEVARPSVHVLGADDRPAAAHRVALVVDDAFESMATDGEGRVALPEGRGTALLLVERTSAPPHVARVELGAGEQRVVLPAGRSLAGRALFAGGEPAAGLELELVGDRSPLDELAAFADELAELGFGPGALLTTDRNGSFAFHGLSADWSGNLLLPLGLRFEGGEASWRKPAAHRVEAPQAGLVLVLERLPRIRGRIVDGSGGVAVGGASVGLWLDHADGETTYNLRADEEGRFEHYAEVSGSCGIRTMIADARRARGAFVEHGTFELDERGVDLGDIALPAGFELRVLVTDGAGTPLEGASTDPAPLQPSGPDGLLAVGGLSEGRRVVVFADGFLPAEVRAVADAAGEPLAVALQPAGVLELSVRDSVGEEVGALQVMVGGARPMFAKIGDGPESMAGWLPRGTARGRWLHARHNEVEGSWLTFRLDERARLCIAELVPGVPFEVRVLDGANRPCAERSVAALEPGELRELALELGPEVRPLAGRVTDERGHPLAGAAVGIGGVRQETDASGRFRFAAVGAEDVALVASMRGYVRAALPELAAPARGRELELRLERARDVELLVTDELGAPLAPDAALVRATGGGPDWRAEPRADGRLVLEDLPVGELTVELELGERLVERTLPAGVERASLTVPRER